MVISGSEPAAHVKFDWARQFDDHFGMVAVFEQRVFDCLGVVDKQAAKQAVLFLDDPVAASVFADEDDSRCRTTRWRFDEFHFGIPSRGELVRSMSSPADLKSSVTLG
jgi:hypothetical protein